MLHPYPEKSELRSQFGEDVFVVALVGGEQVRRTEN